MNLLQENIFWDIAGKTISDFAPIVGVENCINWAMEGGGVLVAGTPSTTLPEDGSIPEASLLASGFGLSNSLNWNCPPGRLPRNLGWLTTRPIKPSILSEERFWHTAKTFNPSWEEKWNWMNPILEAAEKVEEDVVQLEKFRSSVFWREEVDPKNWTVA